MRLRHALLLALFACRTSPPSVPDAGPGCADRWLQQHGLNEFGDPQGTVYTGGTPLFDERSGATTTRAALLLRKHPQLRELCPDLR